MKVRYLALAALLLAVLPAVANAALSVSLVPVASPTNVPAGFTPYDLKVTTDTDWTNQSMNLVLTQGSLYNDATFGGDTQPNPAFFGAVPTLPWDTFFTTPGGYPNVGTTGTLPSFAGSESITSTTMHADQWFDSVNVGPGTFIVARITLSNNAVGSFSGQVFNAQSGGVGTNFSGVIGAPEPASLAALSLGGLALLARKRRRSA